LVPGLIEAPGLKFAAGILTYHNRSVGGVSACTSTAWDSARIRGKMMLQENDMCFAYEKKIANIASIMRREFANCFLIEHNATWYFDMGHTGPWFDEPELLDEMAQETHVGNVALGLERKDASETLVVIDQNSLKYFGVTTEKLKPGENPPESCRNFTANYCTYAIESIGRMGAPKDTILKKDLPVKNGYKLYIFPTLFHCGDGEVERVRELAENGAVCLLMGPTGLVDDQSASLENMERLLGVKVKVDAPQPIIATMVQSSNTIGSSFTGRELVGGGSYNPKALNATTWYRFYADDSIAQPGVDVLARYSDGKPAMVVKKVGKGAIVYSAVPITNPYVYKSIAKYAGVHVYTDTDDAFYANGDFVMIHTKDAGTKKITLRKKATEIREVFTGEVVGYNASEFEVNLPGQQTFVYYVGDNKDFLKRLDQANAWVGGSK
jgi:hypothetical protein